MTTETIQKFFNTASTREFRYLMAEMDKMQDAEDQKQCKHIPIVLTVAIFAELIHRAEIAGQKKKQD